MNVKKLNILFVFIIGSVLLVSMVPTIGGGHGMVNRGIFDRYQISAWNPDQEMNADEDSFIMHGFGFVLDDEEERWVDWLPLDVNIFIDGNEIKLKRYNEAWPNQWYWTSPGPDVWWLGETGEHKGAVRELYFFWYQTFDAGYFAPGDYELHVDYYFLGGPNFQADGLLHVV